MYITTTRIKFGGKYYNEGAEIEIGDKFAEMLLQAECIKEIKPNRGEKSGAGIPPSPSEPKPYEFLTAAQQIEFLQKVDDESLKADFGKYLEQSKSKAKKYLQNRIKV